MIEVLEETLIIRRQPEYRAQAVLEQFLDHPDLKKVIAGLNQSHWGWNLKSQRAGGIADELDTPCKDELCDEVGVGEEDGRMVCRYMEKI